MSVTRSARRPRDRRFPLEPSPSARVEFTDDAGRSRFLPIVDLSAGGLSFVSDEAVEGLVPGARIEDIAVDVGDCRMAGRFLVCHAGERGDGAFVYGGMFYPENEADLLKLNGVIAALGTCRPVVD